MYGNKLARNQSFSWIFAQKLFNGVGHHYVVQTIKTVICQLFLAAKSILNIWHQCVTLAIKAPVCQLFYGINISSFIIIGSSCSCCCCSSSCSSSVTNFASTLTVYYSVINGRILMFKVSKRPYQSSRNDEIIFRWLHNPPGGEKWN